MQHNHTTKEGRCFLLVETLEVLKKFAVDDDWLFYTYENGGGGRALPDGNWQITGKLKDQPPELSTTVELLAFVREKNLKIENVLILEKLN